MGVIHMDLTTPDWAKRHNYFHHSNPRSKDRAKNIFEKAVVRPQVMWAKSVLDNPHEEHNYDKANGILDAFTKNRGSANMAAGRAVQDATDLHLIPDQFGTTLSLVEAIHVAQDNMRKYKPKDYNATVREADTARKEHYIDEIGSLFEGVVVDLFRPNDRIATGADMFRVKRVQFQISRWGCDLIAIQSLLAFSLAWRRQRNQDCCECYDS